MSFASEKSKIKIPSKWFTLGLVILTLAMIAAAIYFDQARAAAFCTIPVVALLAWCGSANITYSNTPKIKVSVWAFCLLYMIAGNAVLMQILSVEAGSPLVSSGPIYQVSVALSHKPSQESPDGR